MRAVPFVLGSLLWSACGASTSEPASSTATARTRPAGPSASEIAAREQREETARREKISAHHRTLQHQQQDALGGTCEAPAGWAKAERCLPSCYATEAADPRANTAVAGPTFIEHVVCRAAGDEAAPLAVIDELGGAKLRVSKARGRFPKPPKKGSWHHDVVTWFREGQGPKLPARDAIAISGTWRTVTHPLTKESLRCVNVLHYTKSPREKLSPCGGWPGTTCEASGSAVARALNVAHYRLAEARRLQKSGDEPGCQQASLEAIALARGLPRWRQFQKLNIGTWKEGQLYKTRFDGLLDEDTVVERITAVGRDAEALHVECGGMQGAKTTAEQEQSFHTCPAADR